jgi:hypothetical protein
MRQVVWQEAVENVIKKSHDIIVIKRLERLISVRNGQLEYIIGDRIPY